MAIAAVLVFAAFNHKRTVTTTFDKEGAKEVRQTEVVLVGDCVRIVVTAVAIIIGIALVHSCNS